MTIFKSLIFLIVAPGVVAGYIPLFLLQNGPRIDTTAFAYLAFPLWLTGAAILLRSFWSFIVEGRGTPAPIDPPKQLVITDFYRYVRNPMYVGIISALIGYFLWFGFWLLLAYAAFVFFCFHLVVTLYEERALKKRFAKDYDDYVEKVPRWIPRFR